MAFTRVVGSVGAGKSKVLMDVVKGRFQDESRVINAIRSEHPHVSRYAIIPQVADRFLISSRVSHLLEIPLILSGASVRDAAAESNAILEQHGLSRLYFQTADTLSGGEEQMVHLLSGYIASGAGLAVDDPFAMLDAKRKGEMRNLLLNGELPVIVGVTDLDSDYLAQVCCRQSVLQIPGKSELIDVLDCILATECAESQPCGGLKQIKIDCNELRAGERVLTKNWSATLQNDRLTVFRGENGTGKSALLSVIGGRNGRSIKFDGRILFRDEANNASDNVLFVPQYCHRLFPIATVGEMLRTDNPHFNDYLARRICSLSLGEARAVTIAGALRRALLTRRCDWVIVDEPEAFLDAELRDILRKLFYRLVKAGVGIIITSHGTHWSESSSFLLTQSGLTKSIGDRE